MNKKYILQKNEDIQKVIDYRNKKVNKYFVVYEKENNLGHSRFCISINKKMGKANIRNLNKRRVKDILMKNKVEFNKDYVIILRNTAINIEYELLKEVLIKTLKGEKI